MKNKAESDKEENWIKRYPVIAFVLGVIIVIMVLAYLYDFFNSEDSNFNEYDSNANINIPSINLNKIAGINDVITLEDLSFKLIGVSLYNHNPNNLYQLGRQYSLGWFIEVINNGENIEEVSQCGKLLFEDGSQYDFNVVDCEVTELVPGAKEQIGIWFFFTSNPTYKEVDLTDARAWEEFSGSEITLFSQQKYGLIKYEIDKNEIEYTNWTSQR